MRRYLLSSVSAIALSAPMQLETWVRAQLVQAVHWLHRQAKGAPLAKAKMAELLDEVARFTLAECYESLAYLNRSLFPRGLSPA